MAVKMVSVGIDPLNRRLTLSVLTLRAKPEGDTEIILGDNLRDSAGDHRVFSRKVAKSVADCTEVPAEYIHELARIRLDHLARRDEHTMNDGVAHSQREAIACAHK